MEVTPSTHIRNSDQRRGTAGSQASVGRRSASGIDNYRSATNRDRNCGVPVNQEAGMALQSAGVNGKLGQASAIVP